MIDSLRRRYREYLWDAEYRDTLGATVTANGRCRHSVFLAKSGKRAVVVVNQEFAKEISVKVELPNPGTLAAATPENQQASLTTGSLHIPARSATVLMEQ